MDSAGIYTAERSMAEQEDISLRLQGGVLTALVHIAAVREPGCKALALEFVAARKRAQEIAASASMPSAFRDVFVPGLSSALFKKALEHQRNLPQRRLDRLGRKELIDAIHPHDRHAYARLVREVATAAATAQVDDDPYRRRWLAPWEHSALLEIDTALTTLTAQSGHDHQSSMRR
jgi:hypothetical protein